MPSPSGRTCTVREAAFRRGRLRDRLALYNLSMLWNPFWDLYTGGDRRPAFFDIDETFPALRRVDQAYDDIRAELDALLPHQKRMPRYHEIDSDLVRASARYHRDKSWNVFMLYSYGARPLANRARCPRTCAVLDTARRSARRRSPGVTR